MGSELADMHEKVSQKCIKFLNIIEEQTLKSESTISLFTNKEMLVFDGKMETRPSEIAIREVDHTVNRESGKLKIS